MPPIFKGDVVKKEINRRKLKKLLKKEFGDLFNIKQFNLLIVGSNIERVNTSCNFSEFHRVVGFSIFKENYKTLPNDTYYQCEVVCLPEGFTGRINFMLEDANIIKNCYNNHYIKKLLKGNGKDA